MEVFYGEKILKLNKKLNENKNIIHQGKKLIISSKNQYTEISLNPNEKLIFIGKIFAIMRNEKTYIPLDMENKGKSIIKKIFSKSAMNDFIKSLEGDFVGCYIKNKNNAILFGDTYNKKDIFYFFTKNGVVASTDLSFMHSVEKISYDQAGIANLLSIYGMYTPKKHTIYKGVRRIGIGERLVLSQDKPQIRKIPFHPFRTKTYGLKELEKYAKILEEAVKIRGSHNTNWVYLSSGWDSTSLLALLVKNFGVSNVNAVIGKLKYSKRVGIANTFEIERAKKVADYYKVHLNEVTLDYTTKSSVKYCIEKREFLKNHHIYADNSYNFFLLSDYIYKKALPGDRIFCGEISDGAHNLGFSQYTTILEHPVQDFREYSDKMASYLFGPTFFKSILNGSYKKDAVYSLLRSRLRGHYFENNTTDEYERKKRFIFSFFTRNRRIPFYSLENHDFLTKKGINLYDSEMFKEYLKECIDSVTPETIYSWILYLYNSFHWQGSTLKSISETANYNNLILTMPFWDKRLQIFLSQMPENWGRGLELRPTKYPLKWMLRNKIDYPTHLQVGPHSYFYDINPDFSFESEMLYGSALKQHFQHRLQNYPFENILDDKYFNIDYFRDLTDRYIHDEKVFGKQLFELYNLVWLCWIGWY
jgi:hypothetical protein